MMTGRKDTRQRIIDAAVEVFLQEGYAKATTRKIAALADLTEVTLFRHFGSKENLFEAAFKQFGAMDDLTLKLQDQLTGDYRQDLRHMGNVFLEFIKEKGDVIRLGMLEAGHFPELSSSVCSAPKGLRQILADYLQEQMDKGVIRQINPVLAANGFWGMFLYNFLFHSILNEPLRPVMDSSEIVAQFVDIFLEGTIVDKKGSE
jgi:AcrR family transcriptional regulator